MIWDLLIFSGALAIAAFSPGPGLAAIVATVLAGGARKAFWFCIGVICGDLVWLALSLSGLALIAQQIPVVFVVIKWAGVAYLAYLALRMWSSAAPMGQPGAAQRERSPMARLLAGFSVTMGNPKAMLFYLALLPSLVRPEALQPSLVMALFAAVVVVLAAVFAVYVFAAHKARAMMLRGSSMRMLNRVTASALGGAAAWIASR